MKTLIPAWPRFAIITAAISVLTACTTPQTLVPVPSKLPSLPSESATTHMVATVPAPTTMPKHVPSIQPSPAIPTQVPTLTDVQAVNFASSMLKTNGDCELPCWWGGQIAPGQTTYDQANDYFASQGVPLFSRGTQGQRGFDIPLHTLPFDYSIGVTVDSGQGTVESIRFNGAAYGGKQSARFAQDWDHYAWYRILTQNGPPQQIRVQFFPTTYGGPAGYKLILFYEPLGMAIEYRGPAQDINGSRVRACPNFSEVTAVNLTLLSPAKSDSLVTSMIPSDDVQFWPSLEEATGMSMETFYKGFKDAKSSICLEELPKTIP